MRLISLASRDIRDQNREIGACNFDDLYFKCDSLLLFNVDLITQ